MKEENTIMTITKDMRIGDLLQMNEMIAPFLMQNGMGCVYCPSSMMSHWKRPAWCTASTVIC